jgi:hypothetical protein
MKRILFTLSLFAAFQIGTAQEQWNACNSNVTVIPTPAYDSTFVLSAPSRAALAKGMANWTPSTSSAASYLVYTALLSQSGTDAPVATVLENTLGQTITWTRSALGRYDGTFSSGYDASKIFLYPLDNQGWVAMPVYTSSGGDIGDHYYTFTASSGTKIRIEFVTKAGVLAEWSSVLDFSTNIPVEIKIYP